MPFCADTAVAIASRYQKFSESCLVHAYKYRESGYVLDPVTGLTFLVSLFLGTVSARLGLLWGSWMGRVQR